MTQALAGPSSQGKKVRVVRREEASARGTAGQARGFVGAGQYAPPIIRHRGEADAPSQPETEQTSPEFSDFERTHRRPPLSEDAAAAVLRAIDGAAEKRTRAQSSGPRADATEELSPDQILGVETLVADGIPAEPSTMRSLPQFSEDAEAPEAPITKPILPVALESSPSADSAPTLERRSPHAPATPQTDVPQSHRRPRSDFADDSAELQTATAVASYVSTSAPAIVLTPIARPAPPIARPAPPMAARAESVNPPSSQAASAPLALMFDTLGKAALKTPRLPPPPPMTTPMTRLNGPDAAPPSTLPYPAMARNDAHSATQPMSAPIALVQRPYVESPSPPSVAILLTHEKPAHASQARQEQRTTDHAFAMITEAAPIPLIPPPALVPTFALPAPVPMFASREAYPSLELLPSYDPQLDTYAPKKQGLSKWLLASGVALVASALFCAGTFIVYAGENPSAAHALQPMRSAPRAVPPSRMPSQATIAPEIHAATPTPAPPHVESGIPTLSVESLPKVMNKYGMLHVPQKYEGHRVYVDGSLVGASVGAGGGDYEIYCGRHSIKIGSQSKGRIVDIPCGGETNL